MTEAVGWWDTGGDDDDDDNNNNDNVDQKHDCVKTTCFLFRTQKGEKKCKTCQTISLVCH